RPSGGIKAQIRAGVDGFLVDTPEEAAEKLRLLLDDPKLRQELGANGKEHVRREFLITANAVNYMKIASRQFIEYAKREKAKLTDKKNARSVAEVFDAAAEGRSGPFVALAKLGDLARGLRRGATSPLTRGVPRDRGPSETTGIDGLIDRTMTRERARVR
ncbi:MAG: glycosyltransferase, partial [Planctomycetota bacterium]